MDKSADHFDEHSNSDDNGITLVYIDCDDERHKLNDEFRMTAEPLELDPSYGIDGK